MHRYDRAESIANGLLVRHEVRSIFTLVDMDTALSSLFTASLAFSSTCSLGTNETLDITVIEQNAYESQTTGDPGMESSLHRFVLK